MEVFFAKINQLKTLYKSSLKTFFSRKISRRLVLTNILLAIIPLLIISFLLILINNKTITEYIYQRNFETAKRAANEINLFLETPRRILITLASSPDISSMERFTQTLLINKIKSDYPLFNNIHIISNSGNLMASTSYEREQRDFSQLPVFVNAVQGKEYLSSIFFSQNNTPVMYISEPVFRFNQVVAVLVGEVDIKTVWDLLDNITLGETGNAFLFSADGTLIGHKDKKRVLAQEKITQFIFYREIINGKSGICLYHDFENTSMVAAYIPVTDLSWGLVLQQSESEAFGLAKKMLFQVILVLIITLILATIISLFLVRRFTKPIFQLIQGVKEFSAGNLKYNIHLPYNDELEMLAKEFNDMAKNLSLQQQQLKKMERMATMSRFASMVSHEIRNPLNSMGINMQMILRLAKKNPIPLDKLEYYISMIASEIDRIDDLIKDFLIIARPPRLNLINIPIHQLLGSIIDLHTENAKQKNIEIIPDFMSDEIFGNFDENQLKQVFNNLIINSFDAMPAGGKITVKTHKFVRNSNGQQITYCQIEFRDSGGGISDEYMSEIFDMYFTTKKTGTGMGLAIARQIIESHRGHIYIHSEKNVGTSVFIELPLTEIKTL